MKLETLYFSKRFLSGVLKGITITQSLTASPKTLARIHIGKRGKDTTTGDRWIVVDASFQNYTR